MPYRVSSVQLGEYWPCIGSDRWNEEAGTKIAALITAWSCTRSAPDQWLQWLKHQTMIGDQPAAEAGAGITIRCLVLACTPFSLNVRLVGLVIL